MSVYKGIDRIDYEERLKQHELTKALWKKLCEMGIKTGYKGRIKGYFVLKSKEYELNLKPLYDGIFDINIFQNDEKSIQLIECITPISRLSLESLIELADIFMVAAVETNTKFDGLELEINEIKKLNSPWWKFW